MIGIFIEPKGKTKSLIKYYKFQIKKKKINSKLTSHPPHLTIYLADLREPKKIFIEIRKILKRFKLFYIKINKIGLFTNDPSTGGDIIYLNVKKSKKLNLLQKKITNSLKFLLNQKLYRNINNKFRDKKMINSQKKFGFPFVGTHWKPHFTISSIKNFINTGEYNYFKNVKINLINKVDKISIWKINGERHFKLKEIKLS